MSRPAPDLTVAIASFNTREILHRCLLSLEAHKGDLRVEVIVVDNASADGSAGMVAARWPRVRLIRNRRNRYLSRALNQALAAARGRYILVLNSDMEVVPGTLPCLAAHLDSHPEVGAASCVEILHGRPKMPLLRQTPAEAVLRRTWLRRFAAPRPDHFVNPAHEAGQVEAEVISDACMMARRDALDGVGGFDERLRLYYTEDDLCARLTRAGWKLHFVARARVIHAGSGSHSVRTVSPLKILWLNYLDTRRYFARHHGAAAGAAVFAAFASQYALFDLPRLLKRAAVTRARRLARRLEAAS